MLLIHPTAIVDEGAKIGEGTRVWHWTHICSGAQIGQNCSLGQNVFVGNDVIIGCNVKVQNNVSVYDAVRLEDDVFCGPSVVFTNVYNPRSAINRKKEYRSTHVSRGATLGANSREFKHEVQHPVFRMLYSVLQRVSCNLNTYVDDYSAFFRLFVNHSP